MNKPQNNICQECGMIVHPAEFHPYEFCILWKNKQDPRQLYEKIVKHAKESRTFDSSSEQAWRDQVEALDCANDLMHDKNERLQKQFNQAVEVLNDVKYQIEQSDHPAGLGVLTSINAFLSSLSPEKEPPEPTDQQIERLMSYREGWKDAKKHSSLSQGIGVKSNE